MSIRYGKFELPSKIYVEEPKNSNDVCRIIAQPFEKGFGHTLGNALRRILLTSLEAPAILSVTIEGVPHEYMSIEGIVQDMTHIILNLKGALIRKLPSDTEHQSRNVKTVSNNLEITDSMLEENKGSYNVTIGELLAGSEYEVINSKMIVFTVTKPLNKKISFRIGIGRGYLPSERIELPNKAKDEIFIDACFSPIRLANYFVESCRVGGDTDMDRLVLEIKTDGRITAKEALSFAMQIGILHFSIFDELKFQSITYDEENSEEEISGDLLLHKLGLKINEIELSVRSTNCLSQANIDTIAELVLMPEQDMLRFRNFGKKSLNEIKAKLEEMELSLGMDLSKYGINRDNVKDVMQKLLSNTA